MRRFYSLWFFAVLLAAVATGAAQSFLEQRHLDRVLVTAPAAIPVLHSLWLETFFRGFITTLLLGIAFLILVTSQMRRWFRRNLAIVQRRLRSLQPASPARKSDSGLPTSLKQSIADKTLVVISNREPYIHQRDGDRIDIVRPASGLVTALEPVLRQCGGLWLAHGGGSADFDVTSASGEIAVPPERATFTLRRVALSPEQEEGYYYGFSNEGLWPLCHLAHNRPTFRLSDWLKYAEVNRLFVDSIPERSLTPDSLFLVQDYHFALLPAMLKKRVSRFRRPKISLFWHIPWPNPEAFGICPWGHELLQGMLGADIIGFHTQYHCNNFLETCNRYLEARIDYERFSVTMDSHETKVQAFPIGIDTSPIRVISEEERDALKLKYGIHARYVAVGVDRIDYTKGIIERVEAVERFLTKNPQYVGEFSLVQMGSPSRTHIPAYRVFHEQLDAVVSRVNERFSQSGVPGYRPVIFLPTHHDWTEIQYFYQLGDVCMVTSLHDGMNLVAKEYVWCQRPDRGALILSKFTGASRELTEAFIVNPYSIEEMADALAQAFSLSPEERGARMTLMREKVHSRNAYHWAGELIEALLRKNNDELIQPTLRGDRSERWRAASAFSTRLWP